MLVPNAAPPSRQMLQRSIRSTRLRGPIVPRLAVVLATVVITGTASCGGDGPSAPSDAASLYELLSVDGSRVPWVSPPGFTAPSRVDRGRLLLRRDGTFMQVLGGSTGYTYWATGTHRSAGGELRLMVSSVFGGPASFESVAELRADSAIFTFEHTPRRWVYLRTPLPSPPSIRDGLYAMSAINGRGAPLIWHDTVIRGDRYVGEVVYDSISYTDGMFFTRVRASRSVAYLARGDSVTGEDFYRGFGTYDGGNGYLILHHYFPMDYSPPRDSLVIGGDALFRRTRLITRVVEERYTRLR